jgi:hypothetical protein
LEIYFQLKYNREEGEGGLVSVDIEGLPYIITERKLEMEVYNEQKYFSFYQNGPA